MDSPEHQRRAIVDYFLSQSPEGTEVEHSERVAFEYVWGTRYDVWDVRASDGRWWVITQPTNLYSHEDEPSMDRVFALHIGLMARVLARQSREAPVEGETRDRAARSWRKYEQAAEALNEGEEAEDFQAVGMRCREALVEFGKEVAPELEVPDGTERPKAADFKAWAALAAATASPGPSGRQIRSYLRDVAAEAWELVGWLTHAANAGRFDGIIAVDATSHVLQAFSMALLRHERGGQERCPECGSYRVTVDFTRDEWEGKVASFPLCEVCGWTGEPG